MRLQHANIRTLKPSFLFLTIVTVLTVFPLHGQITSLSNQTATPIPGAGHDYIHLLDETVNPGSGTVSLRITPPAPRGRNLSLPFSFGYDSGAAIHVITGSAGQSFWTTNQGYLAQGGWSYGVPLANMTNTSYSSAGGSNPTNYSCYYTSGVMFREPTGGLHSLNLAVGDSNASGGYGSYSGCVPSNQEYIPNAQPNCGQTS